ncbi:hypothetical protein KTC96_22685 (plasmid) [Clostridium estertheticum]|uniref:hypothetical protein n=1 Tax=Clostridium estertheticum TaxID=238834 RepID=UPI001C7D7682|nr:hypothetical protein [Clostridium estertheticum]MBX4260395.1 hypothetical protein [Clostridium estertheticum]WLC73023.1 hypothetical protein KTC96_22685 [Clostridium estertheticum]
MVIVYPGYFVVQEIIKLKLIGAIIVIIVAFNASCLTPKGALRTHLFISGHPVIAVTTPITDDEFHNKIDSKFLETENTHCYKVIKLIIDWQTGDPMANYIVRKKGLFYFVEYYGEA